MPDPGARISSRARRVLRETLLTGAALAGVICLLAAIAAIGLDVRPLIFRSGSMSPAIPTGSLALALTVPATELSPGDVVSVTNAGGTRITHRIVSMDTSGPIPALILRGDANTVVDAETYPVTEADRVFFSVPGLGYVLGWLSHPYAIFAGGVLLGVLATLALSSSGSGGSGSPDRSGRHAAGTDAARLHDDRPAARRARGTAWLVAVPVAALTLSMLDPSKIGTQAAFTDTGTTTTGTFRTRTVPPPRVSCSVSSGDRVTLSWQAVAGATSYVVVYTPSGLSPITAPPTTSTSWSIQAPISGSAVVRTNIRYGTPTTTTWTSVNSNTRTYNSSTNRCT